jgi:hypothetical protein
MKKITGLLILLAFALSVYWIYNRNQTTKAKKINNVSALIKPVILLSLKEYQENGLIGLKDLSFKCYTDFPKKSNNLNLLRCMAIDMTAEAIDSFMSRSVGFPKDDYFNSLSIDVRVNIAKGYLSTSQIIETKYLRDLIKPLIDKELQQYSPKD